jgi:hypothetical protein
MTAMVGILGIPVMVGILGMVEMFGMVDLVEWVEPAGQAALVDWEKIQAGL